MQHREELANLLVDDSSRNKSIPIWIVKPSSQGTDIEGLTSMQSAWLRSNGWTSESGKFCLLPDEDGNLAAVVYAYSLDKKSPLKFGALSKKLPDGDYHLHGKLENGDVELLSWALGHYSFDRYRGEAKNPAVSLKIPEDANRERIMVLGESVYLGRDLINTPSNDLGPEELEDAAQKIAKSQGADIRVVRGDDLLTENYPLIHAVGRASVRAPRLIDMTWGRADDDTITLVGKGICFDTGGLNIKPGNSMLLMKKDMGGSASVLALANMIMSMKLRVKLRVIIPAAENSVSGNAFRPGDVIPSRNGMTVEIGNTDAEGRLVLADALALADEEGPQHLMTFATLTGAARVALGTGLPPFYTTDDEFAERLQKSSLAVGDPLWRMPFWAPYDGQLKSNIADVNHISESMFGGSITAALFLKRFVKKAQAYSHFDIYGWSPTNAPGKPKGGEPQGARAVFEELEAQFKS